MFTYSKFLRIMDKRAKFANFAANLDFADVVRSSNIPPHYSLLRPRCGLRPTRVVFLGL